MKGVSTAVKVGILFTALVVSAYAVWKTIGQRPSGGAGYEVWAKFTDAKGLPAGTQVVIAGLPVGEVSGQAIETLESGTYARITMQVRGDIVLYGSASVRKKSASLLGEFFLEIDPGLPTTRDATGATKEHKQLGDGDEIVNVFEASSIDKIVTRFEQSLPKLDLLLDSATGLADDLRVIARGPLKSVVTRIDRLVQDESKTISEILRNANSAIARIESIAGDIKGATREGAEFDRILKNLEDASAEAEKLMTSARNEVEETGKVVREKLDLVDDIFSRTKSVVTKVDEDEGTLGRLVNDSTIADNIEDITEDAKGFLGTLFGMQTYVGLRSEYAVGAGLARHYITVDLQTRPDKFYYIELEKGPRGDYPEVKLVYDPAIGRFRQSVTIEDKIRFSFQFAKKIGWATLRYGLKESTGGVGIDGQFFDNRLKVSVDVFDATFDQLPRLKVTAAYQFFGYLSILGGMDELLNEPDTLDIELVNDDVPIQFNKFRFGRDWFLGAQLKFNDADLAALLTVGGAALTGLVN